jgi:hypothetical protein
VSRAIVALTLGAVLAAGCTGPPAPSDSVASTTVSIPASVTSGSTTYALVCRPVAEWLTDVDLPRRPGEPKLKAIAGVAHVQAVAVLVDDAAGCGLWTLALADGLSPSAVTSIEDEMARGVERFGVTASPVPHDDTLGG